MTWQLVTLVLGGGAEVLVFVGILVFSSDAPRGDGR